MSTVNEKKLELKKIKSQCDFIKSIVDPVTYIKEKFNDNGFIVTYLYFKVLIGKFIGSRYIFAENESLDSKYLQKIRVFNNSKELFVWKTGDGFSGRFRTDEEGEGNLVVDAKQVLWGTRADVLSNEFTRIYEDRGTELILPLPNLHDVDDKYKRVFLHTRNYVDFNQVYQATYVDSRFMCFSFDNEELK